MMFANQLYPRAVQISEEYLGPAGERFIRRQISVHLDIDPEDLQAEDIPKLIRWVKLAYAVLTDNTQLVDKFTSELAALSREATPIKPHTSKKSKNGFAG